MICDHCVGSLPAHATILIRYDEQEYGADIRWKAVATVDGESYYAQGANAVKALYALMEEINGKDRGASQAGD
jgi:hypothetical protein